MRARHIPLLFAMWPSAFAFANFQLGDVNGDGRADMLLRNANGEFQCSTTLAQDEDSSFSSFEGLPIDLAWHVVAHADFDGDDKSDLLLRHQVQGWSLALLDGCVLKEDRKDVELNVRGADVRVVGVADLNDDNKDDLILRDDSGSWSIAFMDSGEVLNTVDDPSDLPKDTQWRVIGIGDFDGNSVDDVLSRHVDGSWQLHSPADKSANAFDTKTVPFRTGSDWRDEATADFDGDGQTDLLLRHADGTWEVQSLVGEDLADVETWRLSSISSDWVWKHKSDG